MKLIFLIFLTALFLSGNVIAGDQLNYTKKIGDVRASFHVKPEITRNSGKTETFILARGSELSLGCMRTHSVAVIKRNDNQFYTSLGSNYPDNVAKQITLGSKIKAKVINKTSEYSLGGKPTIDFELEMTDKIDGKKSEALYRATIINGKVYQFFTNSGGLCRPKYGNSPIEKIHNAFINSIVY